MFISLGYKEEKGASPDLWIGCLRRAGRIQPHRCHRACDGGDLSQVAGQWGQERKFSSFSLEVQLVLRGSLKNSPVEAHYRSLCELSNCLVLEHIPYYIFFFPTWSSSTQGKLNFSVKGSVRFSILPQRHSLQDRTHWLWHRQNHWKFHLSLFSYITLSWVSGIFWTPSSLL